MEEVVQCVVVRVTLVAYLEALRAHIVTRKIRFGLLGNQHAEVVAELDEVLAFVKAAPAGATKFNFAVIM